MTLASNARIVPLTQNLTAQVLVENLGFDTASTIHCRNMSIQGVGSHILITIINEAGYGALVRYTTELGPGEVCKFSAYGATQIEALATNNPCDFAIWAEETLSHLPTPPISGLINPTNPGVYEAVPPNNGWCPPYRRWCHLLWTAANIYDFKFEDVTGALIVEYAGWQPPHIPTVGPPILAADDFVRNPILIPPGHRIMVRAAGASTCLASWTE